MQNQMVSLLLSLSSIILIATTGVAVAASQDLVSEDFLKGNSSYNNSSISFIGENRITGALVDLTAGSGYYSSHPIAIGGGIGSRTEIANDNIASSMRHEVSSAREISEKSEYAATSSSMQSEYMSHNSATTKMQIDETVTSGKVNIGVLSGSKGNAWKNPAIELEEEYVGTYHISKNFSINDSYYKINFADGWLNFYGPSYDFYLPKPLLFSADDVFNCMRIRSR